MRSGGVAAAVCLLLLASLALSHPVRCGQIGSGETVPATALPLQVTAVVQAH